MFKSSVFYYIVYHLMLKKLQLGICFCLFVFSTIKLRNISTVAFGFGGIMNDNYEFLGVGVETILFLPSKKHNN